MKILQGRELVTVPAEVRTASDGVVIFNWSIFESLCIAGTFVLTSIAPWVRYSFFGDHSRLAIAKIDPMYEMRLLA